MKGFGTLARAMALGFLRDRAAVFFTVLFPLMFLVLFGGIFKDQTAPKSEVLQIGAVAVLDQMPAEARTALGESLTVDKTTDREAALEQVRKGEKDAAIEQDGGKLIVHFSAADQVKAANVIGLFSSLTQSASLAAAGVTTPAVTLDARTVEDESLGTIQYVTPGLLGWAIATGATFGAALTLVTWRQKKILRRLRLSPVKTPTVVAARVWVSVGIALVQTAIFIGVALLPYFGLQLSSDWWMTIPLVIVGTLSFMSIGLLAGAFTKTPEAASAVANLVVLPMAFLSGSFFPLDNAPGWLQGLSEIFPLKHLVSAIQAVMVRGESALSVLPEIGILLGFSVVLTLIASFLFKWDDV